MQFGKRISSRALGALLLTVLGGACDAGGGDAAAGQFTGQVDRTRLASVVAVRAVQGNRVIAQSGVSSSGQFRLDLPQGTRYRLELVTRNAARPVAFGANRSVHFDVCQPDPACDLGMIEGLPEEIPVDEGTYDEDSVPPPPDGTEQGEEGGEGGGGGDEACPCPPGEACGEESMGEDETWTDEDEDYGDQYGDEYGDEYEDELLDKDGDGDCSDDWDVMWGEEGGGDAGDGGGYEDPGQDRSEGDEPKDECSPEDPSCFGEPTDPCSPMPVDFSDQDAILSYVQCWLDVLEAGQVDIGGIAADEPDLGCE